MSIPITAAELAMDKSQIDQREKLTQSLSVTSGPVALRRYAAFKAHVTRGIRNGTAMAALYRQRFADQETTTLDQLVEIRDMIRKIVHHVECCHICVSRARDCLTDAPPQADVDALNQRDIDIDAEATNVLKELTALRDTIVQNLTRNAQAQAQNNAAMINPNQAVIDAINRPHSGQALKPKTLNRDFSPVQFDYWKDRVKAYFLASGYTAQPMQLQQQYIFALIEPSPFVYSSLHRQPNTCLTTRRAGMHPRHLGQGISPEISPVRPTLRLATIETAWQPKAQRIRL